MKISKIEVNFARPVDLTEEEMRVIDLIADHAARRTETPNLVHWAAGCGSKPIWSRSDFACGAVQGTPDPRAKESGEPDWDDAVFYVETCARERYANEPFEERRRRSLAEEIVTMLQHDRDSMVDKLREARELLDLSEPRYGKNQEAWWAKLGYLKDKIRRFL